MPAGTLEIPATLKIDIADPSKLRIQVRLTKPDERFVLYVSDAAETAEHYKALLQRLVQRLARPLHASSDKE